MRIFVFFGLPLSRCDKTVAMATQQSIWLHKPNKGRHNLYKLPTNFLDQIKRNYSSRNIKKKKKTLENWMEV